MTRPISAPQFTALVAFVFGFCQIAHAAWTFSPAESLEAPPGLHFIRCSAQNGATSATLHIVSFRPAAHTWAVMDNPEGAFDLGSAAEKRGALAAVNGGYFHPDRTPLGLVIRQGVMLHPLERARILSGLLVATDTRLQLLRTAEFKASPRIREALQAGPFLVDRGKAVAGLNATQSAARTVVFTTDGEECGLLILKSLTLAESAELLTGPGLLQQRKIVRALNLDGGSSSALWVKQTGGAFYSREWKGVRNYLAIVPR